MSESSNSPKIYQLRGQVSPKSCIIAVGGGKGGVGKSMVSSSLAIFLSQMGHKTTLVDMDLGAANLHTCIGEGLPPIGINEYLSDDSLQLKDVVTPTKFANLGFISGASDTFDTVALTETGKSRLMSSLFNLDSEFTILDLSAGTHETTLDFFLMANKKIVVCTPEPSSIENAYRFMKSVFYRKIRRYEFQLGLADTIQHIMRNRNEYAVRSPSDLIRAILKEDTEKGQKLKSVISNLEFEIILNQARSLKDIDLGPSIQSVSRKYFGVPVSLLGHVEYDNAVWQSLRKRKPLLTEYPHSKLYSQLMNISRKLCGANLKKAAG